MIKLCGPTQRAADWWDAARFQAVFKASTGFRFRALSTSHPLAANANRWAACVLGPSFFTDFDRQERATPACDQRGPTRHLISSCILPIMARQSEAVLLDLCGRARNGQRFASRPGEAAEAGSVSVTPPNTACTRLVGVCAFFSSLCGLELIPAKRRPLVPPTSGYPVKNSQGLRQPLGSQGQNMKMQRRRLEELSQLRYQFYTCAFMNKPHAQALIVAFHGEYGFGAKGNEDAVFMTAIIKAGLEAWGPSALILDLKKLKYEWGDMIGSALTAGSDRYIGARFPTAVVISDQNRQGLISFVEKELGDDPTHWLFESFEEALQAIEEQDANLRAA